MLHDNKPILCYVTDRRSLAPEPGATPEHALAELAEQAARAGVDWVQIREKDLGSRALFTLTSAIVKRAAPARVLVNDRLDVAVAAGAAGVHLGGDSLPTGVVARWCKQRAHEGFSVGQSCHTIEQARAAERNGADYVIFAPVFATPSKLRYGPPQGVERLRELCRTLGIPVIAIGGITPENAAQCIAAGAAGVAAIRWFQQPGELAARVAALRSACR